MALLTTRILADNTEHALAFHDLAIATETFHGGSYFHETNNCRLVKGLLRLGLRAARILPPLFRTVIRREDGVCITDFASRNLCFRVCIKLRTVFLEF